MGVTGRLSNTHATSKMVFSPTVHATVGSNTKSEMPHALSSSGVRPSTLQQSPGLINSGLCHATLPLHSSSIMEGIQNPLEMTIPISRFFSMLLSQLDILALIAAFGECMERGQ